MIKESELILLENPYNNIIKDDIIFIRKICGNGNCYFRCLNLFFTDSQNYYNYYRNYIYNYLKANEIKYALDYPFIYRNEKIVNFKEYIQSLNTDSFFSGEFEMRLTVDIFSINVLILEYNEIYKGFVYKNKIENINNEKVKPTMILEYTTINSIGLYNILYLKDNYNIKDYINKILKLIWNKYNYYYLRK